MVVHSINEYLSAIDHIVSYDTCHAGKSDLIFRGLSDCHYKLLPGMYRMLQVERGDGACFYPQYSAVSESEVLHHFIKNAMCHVDYVDKDDLLTWLTYAQHFGVPTRLMDFSSNPLISLYFCCKSEPRTDGAVAVLHEKQYVRTLALNLEPGRTKREVLDEIMQHIGNPAFPCTAYPVTFIPHYIDARMEMQESRFLIWGSEKTPFDELAQRYGDMARGEEDAFFCKIIVDGASKTKLLRELSFLGVNEKKMFPGLDGIGKYVAQYYRKTPGDYM